MTRELSRVISSQVVVLVHRLEQTDLGWFEGFLIDNRLDAPSEIQSVLVLDAAVDHVTRFEAKLLRCQNSARYRVVVRFQVHHFHVVHLRDVGECCPNAIDSFYVFLVIKLLDQFVHTSDHLLVAELSVL